MFKAVYGLKSAFTKYFQPLLTYIYTNCDHQNCGLYQHYQWKPVSDVLPEDEKFSESVSSASSAENDGAERNLSNSADKNLWKSANQEKTEYKSELDATKILLNWIAITEIYNLG